MNKRISANVLARFPELQVCGSFFVFAPVRDVICGFLIESPPFGTYYWHFAVPAYDRVELLHMTFGDRLFSGDKTASATEEAQRFIDCIEPKIDVICERGHAAKFLKYIEGRELLKNAWGRRAQAMTLAYLGQRDAALAELDAVAAMEGVSRYDGFVDDVREVRDALKVSADRARALLEERRHATLKKFALSAADSTN